MSTQNAISRTEPGSPGAVKAVSVISTGTVRIRPEHPYGSRKPLYWWLFTSRQWTPPRPVNVYVIEHASGLILFDTGQDRASVTDESYFPGGLAGHVYDRLARFDIGEQDTLTAQLATLGYSPADVSTAIVSHLHQDHIGGLAELAGSELLAPIFAPGSPPLVRLKGAREGPPVGIVVQALCAEPCGGRLSSGGCNADCSPVSRMTPRVPLRAGSVAKCSYPCSSW
jgi:glyoxylase-like metal-dependent hydrolase (beta-lactamase superfamily II)